MAFKPYPNRMYCRFDLKGSWVDRTSYKHKDGEAKLMLEDSQGKVAAMPSQHYQI